MTPSALLAANVDALVRAQGTCPSLGAPRAAVRLVMAGDDFGVELFTGNGVWEPLDGPSEPSSWLAGSTAARQVIFTGLGVGHALADADRLGIERIVAIEPDPGLATLFLSRRDWSAWFDTGRLRLLTGSDYRGAADSARFLDGLADVALVTHPRRTRLEPRAMAAAEAVASRIAASVRANGAARRKFAGPYLLQTLANLRTIAHEPGVEALDQACAGLPAMVVGAGPSLDRNAKDLARFQDRGVVIAADTALRPLVMAGVRPHLVVAADPSELNARHLTAVGGVDDVMLVAEGSVHPSGLSAFAGRAFVFRVSQHEPWPWLATAGITRGGLRTWGSVLTSAFSLARRLGCNPIVFAGADLAFTDGRPYCRGTIYDAMWDEWIAKGCTWEQLRLDYLSRQPEVWLDDVHGCRVRTAPHLLAFRDWLVDEAGRASGTTCVNATEGGILHGAPFQHATLAEALGAARPTHGVRTALRRRHDRSARRDAARLRVLQARLRATPETLPVDRWLAFAAGEVGPEAIADALAPGLA